MQHIRNIQSWLQYKYYEEEKSRARKIRVWRDSSCKQHGQASLMGIVFKGRPEAGGGVSTAALWANDHPCPESTTHQGSVVEGSGVFQEQQGAREPEEWMQKMLKLELTKSLTIYTGCFLPC